MKVVYAHRIVGEGNPFYIGSGSVKRANELEHRPSRWVAFVAARTSEVVVEIIESHVCEGQARYREAELIGQHNPPANYIAAIRSASDMLTGRAKGAKDCKCGTIDCRMTYWNSLSKSEKKAEIAAHRARVRRNKTERSETSKATVQIDPKPPRQIKSPSIQRKGEKMSKMKQMESMTPAMQRNLAEFLDAEATGRKPELTSQQRGTTARALVVSEGMSYEAALGRVRAAF